jgi:hypothetical protein
MSLPGKILIEALEEAIDARDSILIETTMSGTWLAKHLRNARTQPQPIAYGSNETATIVNPALWNKLKASVEQAHEQ